MYSTEDLRVSGHCFKDKIETNIIVRFSRKPTLRISAKTLDALLG